MPDQYLAFVMPQDEFQRKAYTEIAQTITDRLNIVEPVFSGSSGSWEFDKLASAKKIGELIGENKALVIARPHLCMTFCYPLTDAVIFDYHNDSYFCYDYPLFNDGNFLLKRNSRVFILGTSVRSYQAEIKTYPPTGLESALKDGIGEKIFLSLDIDVFSRTTTTAHYYPHRPFFPEWLGFRDGLSFEQLLAFTPRLLENRTLAGINLAGYAPELDKNHSTQEFLKVFLLLIKDY